MAEIAFVAIHIVPLYQDCKYRVLVWTVHMSGSNHLISQAGWNRCNLPYYFSLLVLCLSPPEESCNARLPGAVPLYTGRSMGKPWMGL